MDAHHWLVLLLGKEGSRVSVENEVIRSFTRQATLPWDAIFSLFSNPFNVSLSISKR